MDGMSLSSIIHSKDWSIIWIPTDFAHRFFSALKSVAMVFFRLVELTLHPHHPMERNSSFTLDFSFKLTESSREYQYNL